MRLGLSVPINMESAKKWAETQKSLGCGSVVFPLNADSDEKIISEYVKAAKENDLLIAEVGIWRNAMSPDLSEAKKNFEYSVRQLRLADEIGARCCVNVAGSTGKRWDGAYKENFSKDVWKKTVKTVQSIIDEVNPKNTYFTLEPMPWMIPTGPQEYMNLIEDVARDRFAVHMDIINMINCPDRYFFHDEFLDEVFDMLKGRIRSCHLKDILLLEDFTFQLRETGCGKGTFNIEHYVELANKEDPDMPMIIEHLKTNEEYIESIAYVRRRLGV